MLQDTLQRTALLRRNLSNYRSAIVPLSPLGWWRMDEDSGLIVTNSAYNGGMGAELLSNGDFSDWTADNPDNWAVFGESLPNRGVTQDGEAANIFSDASLSFPNYPRIQQNIFTRGKTYQVITDIESITGSLYLVAGNNTILYGLYNSAGVKTLKALPIGAADWERLFLGHDSAFNAVINSVSVRQIGALDGYVAGTTALAQAGASPQTGNAINFDGATSRIEIFDATLHGLAQLSMMVLARLDSAGEANNGHLLAKTNEFIFRVLADGQVELSVGYSTTTAVAVSATSAYSTGQWTWFGCCIDSDRVPHIYIDGEEVSYATQTTGVGTRSVGTGSLYIGNDAGQLATLDGDVDEVLLFDHALNEVDFVNIVAGSGL